MISRAREREIDLEQIRKRKPDEVQVATGSGKRPRDWIRDRGIIRTTTDAGSMAECTGARAGVVAVVSLAVSSAVGLVISAGIVLLPPHRDHTCYVFTATSGATRRPNAPFCFQQDG
jgi:hypothetical protein